MKTTFDRIKKLSETVPSTKSTLGEWTVPVYPNDLKIVLDYIASLENFINVAQQVNSSVQTALTDAVSAIQTKK